MRMNQIFTDKETSRAWLIGKELKKFIGRAIYIVTVDNMGYKGILKEIDKYDSVTIIPYETPNDAWLTEKNGRPPNYCSDDWSIIPGRRVKFFTTLKNEKLIKERLGIYESPKTRKAVN